MGNRARCVIRIMTWCSSPGGWQAYPLPVENVGQPHLLEIEYPNDLLQTLGISIVEPNAVGKVVPLGLDSGVHVMQPAAGDKPRMLRHKLIFWPRTTTPLVLLTNRHGELPAVFGAIRIYTGPSTLPPADTGTGAPQPARLLAAYFDKPLFPENFSASEVADEGTGAVCGIGSRSHEGGKRLIEYLKHVGYNGAVICVARQGSRDLSQHDPESNSQVRHGNSLQHRSGPCAQGHFGDVVPVV